MKKTYVNKDIKKSDCCEKDSENKIIAYIILLFLSVLCVALFLITNTTKFK
jgi:hypothetical protein